MDTTKEQLFFNVTDSTKIKAFLQIPKALFVNPLYKKMPLTCKLAYSIYVQRFTITTYKDDVGPYIIFSDKEMAKLIDCSEKTVAKIRVKLNQVGLISYKRTVSFNKIYVYSYTKDNLEDKVFYYENDIDSWKFYRFPIEFFESKYDNLPLEAKFIYSIYFDTMCLSKANYFTDDKERIYFQESFVTQELKSNFSNNTLKKYRNYLKACQLLYEYQPFGQKIRYYLIKLDMFEDNVFTYEQLEDVDKTIFIQNKMNLIKEKYIDVQLTKDISFIKKGIREFGLDKNFITELIFDRTGKKLSTSGLKKYLNETRNMPDDIYNLLHDYIDRIRENRKETSKETFNTQSNIKDDILENQENTPGPTVSQKGGVQESQIITEQFNKKETTSIEDKKQTVSQISFEDYLKEYSYINKTTLNNETDIKNTLLNKTIEKINNINVLISEDKDFLIDTFKYLSNQEFIQTKKKLYEKNDLNHLMQYFIDNAKNIAIPLLNRLYSGNQTFYTAESVIKYFITMLINDYELQQTTPNWFQSNNSFALDEYRSRIKTRYPHNNYEFENTAFDEGIINYKWWEDEN